MCMSAALIFFVFFNQKILIYTDSNEKKNIEIKIIIIIYAN